MVQPEFSSDGKRILIKSSRYRSIVWEWQSEPAKTLEEDLAGKTMKGNGEIDEAERNFPALGVPNVNVTVIDGELVAEDQFGQRLPKRIPEAPRQDFVCDDIARWTAVSCRRRIRSRHGNASVSRFVCVVSWYERGDDPLLNAASEKAVQYERHSSSMVHYGSWQRKGA